MSADEPPYEYSVFINCPYDHAYEPMHNALVFTVCDCGFIPRSALESEGQPDRFTRICEIIRGSRLGIHELSRVGEARQNMPFELGLFAGAREFGNPEQREKSYVMLDEDRHRYLTFISDLRGNDPIAHGNSPEVAVTKIRNWLQGVLPPNHENLLGGAAIWDRYLTFCERLDCMAEDLKLDPTDLTFQDRCTLVEEFIAFENGEPEV